MEWTDNLNKAVQYIEEHIKEEIDYEIVASIACCSLSKFQRLFTFMADTPVSDYVRYRKMTLAAKELMIGESKIIDLALDFGYESPEAFTRAYQNFHGVPPSVSRKLGIYNKYDRVTFQINIQGGHVRMGTKPNITVVNIFKM